MLNATQFCSNTFKVMDESGKEMDIHIRRVAIGGSDFSYYVRTGRIGSENSATLTRGLDSRREALAWIEDNYERKD